MGWKIEMGKKDDKNAKSEKDYYSQERDQGGKSQKVDKGETSEKQ